jgi:nucleoporin NUP82
MNTDSEWNEVLKNHPIFSLPNSPKGSAAHVESSFELSANTLPRFLNVGPLNDEPTPSGRRQTMVLKDADLIVAAGKEIRMTSLGDSKSSQNTKKAFKVCEPGYEHSVSCN